MVDCCLCSKLDLGEINANAFSADRVLFESRNFVVIPTVGAFIEGWMLIVPRVHYLCMAEMDDDELRELKDLRGVVEEALRDCYGQTIAFEHGPATPGKAAGCGVDHAHLHIVPTTCNPIAELEAMLPYDLNWQRVQGIGEVRRFHVSGRDYLYVEFPSGHRYAVAHAAFESQLFRKALAAHAGQPQRYDWRAWPQEEGVLRTVQTLLGWASRGSNLGVGDVVARI